MPRPRAILRAALAMALIAHGAAPALSGAWPREKGRAFLAAATRLAGNSWDGPYRPYTTAYLEYGLGGGITLGLDFGHGVSGQTKAIAFLRAPPLRPAPGHLVSAELGFGTIAGQWTLRPGLAWGRGFSRPRGGSGWFEIASYAELRPANGRTDTKTDLTVGFNHGTALKAIYQIQTGTSAGDPPFARFAPSLVMRLDRGTHLELGLSAGLAGADSLGLKFGFWREF